MANSKNLERPENGKNTEKQTRSEFDRILGDAFKRAIDEDGGRPDLWEIEDSLHHFRAEEIIRKAEQRKRRVWGLRIAAVLCAAFVITGAALAFQPAPEADPTEVVDSLSGEVNESGIDGESKQGNVDKPRISSWTITDEAKIAGQKANNPRLRIPGYIPDGYTFSELTVCTWETGAFQAKYSYENGGSPLTLLQLEAEQDLGWTASYVNVDTKKTEDGMLYYQVDEAKGINNLYLLEPDGATLQVSGNLKWEELERILEEFTL